MGRSLRGPGPERPGHSPRRTSAGVIALGVLGLRRRLAARGGTVLGALFGFVCDALPVLHVALGEQQAATLVGSAAFG